MRQLRVTPASTGHFAPRPGPPPQKQLRPMRQLCAAPPVSRPGIPPRHFGEPPSPPAAPPFLKLHRLRQKCDAPETAAGSQLGPPAAPPKAAPPIPPTLRRHRRPAPRPSFGRSGPGQPPPASGPSGQLHVARQTPSSTTAHERDHARFERGGPVFTGCWPQTSCPGDGKRRSRLLALATVIQAPTEPPQEGGQERDKDRPAPGFSPAPQHEQFAAPQHRRPGRTRRGQRSSRSTQLHAVPPHQQLAAQQYRFSAQRSTAFRYTAVPQFRRTAAPAFRNTAAPHFDNRTSPLKLAGRNSRLIWKTAEGTESPIPVNRNALRRFPIYRQTGRSLALTPDRPSLLLAWTGSPQLPVAIERDQCPDRLDHTEWPCPGEEAVGAREGAAASEGEDKSSVAPLQGVHHHHERERGGAEDGEHHISLTAIVSPHRRPSVLPTADRCEQNWGASVSTRSAPLTEASGG